jgi:hypothetical protein
MTETLEKNEKDSFLEQKEEVSLDEEITAPFQAKELKPNRLEFEVDKNSEGQSIERYGFKARVVINFDPRSNYHVLQYEFDDEGADLSRNYPFNDDFKRAINSRFKDERGRSGGRDTRFVQYERSEEAQKEFERLKNLLEKTGTYLEKLYLENELPPSRDLEITLVPVSVPSKVGYIQNREENYEGDTVTTYENLYDVLWVAGQEGKPLNWDGKNKVLGVIKQLNKQRKDEVMKNPKHSEEVLEEFENYKRRIQEKFSELPLETLKENIKKIQEELEQYKKAWNEGPAARVYVKITGPEPQVKKEFLKEEKKQHAEASKEEGKQQSSATMADLMSKFGGGKKEKPKKK